MKLISAEKFAARQWICGVEYEEATCESPDRLFLRNHSSGRVVVCETRETRFPRTVRKTFGAQEEASPALVRLKVNNVYWPQPFRWYSRSVLFARKKNNKNSTQSLTYHANALAFVCCGARNRNQHFGDLFVYANEPKTEPRRFRTPRWRMFWLYLHEKVRCTRWG